MQHVATWENNFSGFLFAAAPMPTLTPMQDEEYEAWKQQETQAPAQAPAPAKRAPKKRKAPKQRYRKDGTPYPTWAQRKAKKAALLAARYTAIAEHQVQEQMEAYLEPLPFPYSLLAGEEAEIMEESEPESEAELQTKPKSVGQILTEWLLEDAK